MSKDKCGIRLGSREDEVCYRETGHEGKCFKSKGHEAEYLVQALLVESGYRVVKGTVHEDHILKIDFWIFGEEVKKVNDGDEFLAIQFTTDLRAAYGFKGQDCIQRGIMIVYIDADMILEWKKSKDYSLREKICNKFWQIVFGVAQTHPYMKHIKPANRLARFELAQ